MEIIGPLLISFVAGISTVLGALIIYFKINRVDRFISFCLSFSLSVMISISIFELIPESLGPLVNSYGIIKSLIMFLIIFLIGVGVVWFLNKKINNHSTSNLYKVGILSMFALFLHNMPEGILTFMTSYIDIKMGISLALAIMMHNIPEGISIAIPIYYSTGSKKKGIGYSFIASLAEPIGAILGYVLFKDYINNIFISFLLILVSGIMISISINKLYPEVVKYNEKKSMILGIILGVIITLINILTSK